MMFIGGIATIKLWKYWVVDRVCVQDRATLNRAALHQKSITITIQMSFDN